MLQALIFLDDVFTFSETGKEERVNQENGHCPVKYDSRSFVRAAKDDQQACWAK